ncbi:MAG: SDR family NAD(P)-dependent oxidoreductase [Erysipelotrichaceae bacterium]|nr:SDR family NAD(P)-dependent oxidoreductase [Erysipelotrichaceae bacterium]
MNNFDSVKGKVAVVTGATAGIGKAIAKVFADNGMKVVLAARRKELGEQIAEDIRNNGGEAIFVQADVSNEEDVKKVMECAVKTYGKLNVVINNAGAST